MYKIAIGVLLASASTAQSQSLPMFKDFPAYFVHEGRILGKYEGLYAFPDPYRKELEKSLNAIEAVKNSLSKNGVRLIVAIVPGRINFYRFPEEMRRVVGDTSGTYLFEQNWLKSKGIETVDLLNFFRDSKYISSEPGIFYRYDIHWTPLGAFEAAKAIAEVVGPTSNPINISASMNPVKPRGVMALKSNLKELPGDLKDEMTVSYNIVYPPIGITDDEESEISLVGTSFSAGFAGDALSFALKTRVQNFAVPGKGQWEPMYKYITSDEWKINKPKTIIWEMPEHSLIYISYTEEQLKGILRVLD